MTAPGTPPAMRPAAAPRIAPAYEVGVELGGRSRPAASSGPSVCAYVELDEADGVSGKWPGKWGVGSAEDSVDISRDEDGFGEKQEGMSMGTRNAVATSSPSGPQRLSLVNSREVHHSRY